MLNVKMFRPRTRNALNKVREANVEELIVITGESDDEDYGDDFSVDYSDENTIVPVAPTYVQDAPMVEGSIGSNGQGTSRVKKKKLSMKQLLTEMKVMHGTQMTTLHEVKNKVTRLESRVEAMEQQNFDINNNLDEFRRL